MKCTPIDATDYVPLQKFFPTIFLVPLFTYHTADKIHTILSSSIENVSYFEFSAILCDLIFLHSSGKLKHNNPFVCCSTSICIYHVCIYVCVNCVSWIYEFLCDRGRRGNCDWPLNRQTQASYLGLVDVFL